MRRDAEVPELQLLALAHENVEWREITMQRLTAVQCVERAEDRRELPANESLGLRSVFTQPDAKIAVFGVFDREAVPHPPVTRFSEAIEHAKRSVLTSEELREIGLAHPRGD